MTGQVTLSSAINSNLLSLQNTKALLDQTQLRLSTGKKVNSALDNPGAFFAAQSLDNRSGDLSNVLDAISQGVQTIQTANDGITAITSLLQQAQSVAQQALSESNANAGGAPTDQTSLQNSFNQILKQVTNIAKDANYQGTNLLDSATNTLTITYDETGNSKQTIQGVDFTAGSSGSGGGGGNVGAPGDTITLDGFISGSHTISLNVDRNTLVNNINTAFTLGHEMTASLDGSNHLVLTVTAPSGIVSYGGAGQADLGLPNAPDFPGGPGPITGTVSLPPPAVPATGGLNIADANFSSAANIQASLTAVTAALTTVRAQASTLGQNLGTVQTYQAFNQNLINDLKKGSSDLTAADTNSESAALLTLQTQEQLGISALSLASQAQQAVLRLFP